MTSCNSGRRVSLRANPSSIRLSRRGREIHPERIGGTESFVLNGAKSCNSSHFIFVSGDEPPGELFLLDDLAFKIPASNERSRNQTCQTTTSYCVLLRCANSTSCQTLQVSFSPKYWNMQIISTDQLYLCYFKKAKLLQICGRFYRCSGPVIWCSVSLYCLCRLP